MSKRLDVAIFVLALVASLIGHVALIEGLGSAARNAPRRQYRAVEMAIVEPPPPPPPPPEPPKPKPVDLTQEKRKAPVEVPKSNTTEAPPPDKKEPPKPVFGISMSSVVGPGSGAGFNVRVGNTLMKEPENEFTSPDEVRPYRSLHEVSKMPERIRDCQVPYPAAARSSGIEGSVRLDVEVRDDGTVGTVKVVKGLSAILDATAMEAMKSCLFKPGRIGDAPVTTHIPYAYTFVLED